LDNIKSESTESLFNKLAMLDSFHGQSYSESVLKKEEELLNSLVGELKARIPSPGIFLEMRNVFTAEELFPKERQALFRKYRLMRNSKVGLLFPI
jgi:hypothetical protein